MIPGAGIGGLFLPVNRCRTMKKTAFITAVAAALISCGPRTGDGFQPRPFPEVGVPAMLTEQSEAAAYLAEHFWDAFTDTARLYRCDSVTVNGVKRDDLEQEYANYMAVLGMAGPEVAPGAVKRLLMQISAMEEKDTASNVFETLSYMTTRYLYDPNSPFRNEDFYLPFVEGLSHSEFVPDEMKPGYEYDVRMCSLNRVGTKAADFRFCDSNGRRHTLYGIRAEYVILFFSNPGCNACKEIMDALDTDAKVVRMIEDGRLAVLNIYIDEDLDGWRKYMPIYPDSWYNGYDPDYVIRTDVLYNVRAIPSLYLLDADKTVLMKDTPPERLFFWLENVS